MAEKNGSIHKDHRKRLKTRFRKEGLDHFDELYVLELLLFFGIPQGDTNPLAHRLLDRPAFWVTEGIVREVNPAAASRFISPGMGIRDLLSSGYGDYAQFSSGCLYLTLSIGSAQWPASVTRLGEGDLFTLDPEEEDTGLRCYSLAAQELRTPLSQLLSISDQLFPAMETCCDSDAAAGLARMNRAMHQILRVVNNMSDASRVLMPRMELRDITAVMQEILDHAEPLCRSAGITLAFENHPEGVYTMLEYQQLERAVYNLLSNAMKRTASGGTITVRLKRRLNRVFLTVENPGSEASPTLSPGTMSRFLREPGLEDSRNGLGLGLPLVRAAAAAHHGTLLLEQLKTGGFRATMSLPIRQDSGTLRSPVVHIDYAGGRDQALIELSESLPPEWYLPSNQ